MLACEACFNSGLCVGALHTEFEFCNSVYFAVATGGFSVLAAGGIGLRANRLHHVARKAGFAFCENLAFVSGLATSVSIKRQIHEKWLVRAL